MTARESPPRRDLGTWVAYAGVSALVFVLANRLLLTGRAVGIWDVDGQYFPRFVLVADHARAGHFLRWDPWTDAGLPSFSEPQIGAFSPILNLFGLVLGGRPAAFIAYWLFHWALGGAGIFVLARHLRAPAWGACVVALGYLFSGVYTGHAQHTTFVAGFSWLPWIIWQVDLALERRSLRHAAQAGAIWGVGALAGHPSVTILTGCFVALWVLGRVLFGAASGAAPSPRRSGSLARGAAALGTVAVVGVIVLSPTYVGELLEGRGVHTRSEPLSRVGVAHNEFPPAAMVTLVSAYPARIKAFFPEVVWPWTHVSMVSIYSGVLIPLLALCALASGRSNRWQWWLLGVGLFSLAAAMGQSLPVRGWLYEWVYPTRFFRHSAVFRMFFVFPLAVLALQGSKVVDREIRSDAGASWGRFALGGAIAAGAAILAYEWFLIRLPVATGRAGPLFAFLWLVPLAIGLVGLRRRDARRWIPAMLVVMASADALLTEQLSRLMMVGVGKEVRRWHELDTRHQQSLSLTSTGLLRTESICEPWSPKQCWRNDQLITRLPTLRGYATFTSDFHQVISRHPVLRASASGKDRMWFASTVAMAPTTDTAFAAFVRRTDSLGAPPLVVHTRAQMLGTGAHLADPQRYAQIDSLPGAQHVAVRVLDYEPNELAIRFSAPDTGWLMVTERWAPGWRATVNGQSASTFGANFIFRAVQVQRGENVVRFTYHPAGYPWLLAASWLTLACVIGWSVKSRVRARSTAVPV